MNEYESPIMKHIVVVYGDKYLSIENTNVRSNVCNEVRCSSDIVLINDGVGDMKVLINDQRDLNLRKGVKGIRKLDEKLTIFPCNFVERKILQQIFRNYCREKTFNLRDLILKKIFQ